MIQRGQIWWVDLAEPRGAAPGYRHPALVVQRDEVNRGNTLLPKRSTGLPRDSVANASQIATLDQADLEDLVGMLPRALMHRVDEGLRWFLALDRP